MSMHEGLALVLDAKDYRESSSLVRLLTAEEGRISLIARGLRKGKGGAGPATQAFCLVRVRYSLKEGATLGNLATVELEHPFPVARTSLEAYALISYWFEILKEASQPRENVDKVFRLTLDFLNRQEAEPGMSMAFINDLAHLCRLVGFGLSWTDCAVCGRRDDHPTRFSIRSGAILCRDCVARGEEGLLLRPDEQRIIRALTGEEPQDITPGQAALVNMLCLVNRYLMYHLEHPLKTFAFVESIFGH